jgi:hypothetical protein
VRDRARLSGAPLGPAQQQQQRRAPTRRRRLREPAARVARGDLRRTLLERLLGRIAQPLHHPLIPGRAAREQMRSDPRQRPQAVLVDERCGAPVRDAARARRDVLSDRRTR